MIYSYHWDPFNNLFWMLVGEVMCLLYINYEMSDVSYKKRKKKEMSDVYG